LSDNPFSEPADNERTVIRPMPGGRRSMLQPRPSPPQPAAPTTAEPDHVPVETGTPAISVSPLVAAASPLLQLLVRLRSMRQPPHPQRLRERIAGELRAFERRAREAGIKMELLRPAHYALCASMDDVVLNTPWGASGGWGAQPLVTMFHEAARDTDQFFEHLRQFRKDPAKFLPVLELMYLCLSLGFMGRYRHSRGGAAEFDRLRGETQAVIAAQQQEPIDQELSRRWRSVVVPYQPSRGRFPVWVAVAAALAVCGGLFVWVSTNLNAESDVLQAQVLAAPPSRMPDITRSAVVQPVTPPPASTEPSIVDRLRGLLKPEIDKSQVSVLGTATTPIIRIADRGMFASGSATLQAASMPLLARIGAALKNEPGSLLVLAFTDNQPIRTVQFPSNFQLSAARAHAVQTIIARSIGDPARVSAEGRADADPIAPNTTAQGREQNRRIEIVFRRQD